MIVFTCEMHLAHSKAVQIRDSRDLCSLLGQHVDVSLEVWHLLQNFLNCFPPISLTI